MEANSENQDGPVVTTVTAVFQSTAVDEKNAQFVGSVLFGFIISLIVLIFLLAGGSDLDSKDRLIFFRWNLSPERVLLLAVLCAGALGGCIHVATSFGDYVGNAQYKASWRYWYLLRPFIGACLATAFYFLIRGGILSLAGAADPNKLPNFFGMTAIAFLVGMFSKQATDKLDDVFDTLFKSNKDNERQNSLVNTVPVLNSIIPASVLPGSPDLQLELSGSNFLSGAVVRVNGVDRIPDEISTTRLKVTLKATELTVPAQFKISVVNPGGVGSSSAELLFVVEERRQELGSADDRHGPAASRADVQPTSGDASQQSQLTGENKPDPDEAQPHDKPDQQLTAGDQPSQASGQKPAGEMKDQVGAGASAVESVDSGALEGENLPEGEPPGADDEPQ